MYALYKQVHPPTGIEHCLYCNFFSQHEKNLVIAGGTQLNVYRLHGDVDTSSKPTEKDIKSKKHKLEHVGSFSLFGNVMSMQSTRLTGTSRDVLCLTFKEAKLSVVEYDPGTHDLKTLSMHYFEEEALKEGYMTNYQVPPVIVDPENRCAVMLIYGKQLVVLPFRREGTIDDQQENVLPGSSKSSFLPSYLINLHDIDEKLINVTDIQFLHGYYEPTLFILFEPLRTWPGRVAIRKDTYCIVAISLNIEQRVHPVIWSLNNLPFDCFKVIPVPKPIGGVLVFAVNSLIYLNQSVPPYGVSLNGLTDGSTQFPLKIQDGVKISLDCAQASFVMYDRLVISLKGGEIYVLTIMTDGMRSVRGFHFDKAAASVLTSCIVTMEDGYLFLGSRLGNSLLLKYTEKVQDTGELSANGPKKDEDKENKSEGEPPTKKKRTDDASDWIASDVALLADDLDELEVYGSETTTGTRLTSYTFEVCDSIMNIGPCGKAVMGEPVFLSEEFQNNQDPDLELVSCAGYGKNGALSVLQRSIRPQVVTTFELPGCIDMWTVIGPPEKKDGEAKESEETTEEQQNKQEELNNSHAFLILSREDSSMILQTGQEIMELDHSGFSTQGPTVFAGNIGNNAYILQVSPMGVRLLEGVEQLQHIPLDLGSPIALCSVADPYAVIMSEKGDLVLLTLRPDGYGSGHRLAILRPQLPQKSRLLTLCAYKDVSGIFTSSDHMETAVDETEPVEKKKGTQSTADVSMTSETSNIDDEDELLYGGDSDAALFNPTKKEEKPSLPTKPEVEIKPSYWCAVCRENGVLEIYNLPDFKLAFLVKSFPMGHRVLVDTFQVTSATSASGSSSTAEQHHDMMPQVKELYLVGMGHKNKRPHLMATVDEELLIYEAFEYHQSTTLDNHLRVRFKKINHGILTREKRKTAKKQSKSAQAENSDEISQVKHLRYFEDVSGYSGVFVCGPYPHWLFMTTRGKLRAHPMYIDGSVTCFAPFHNVNCPKGFLYFNKHGELRICVLPTHLSYDSHWPVRKVPLRCTPHFISYHMESKTYAVVTSIAEPCNRICKMSGDEKEFEEVERGERFVFPTIERFSLQLFSPLSWEAIPQTKIEMEDWEHITDLKTVSLKSEGTVSGLKGYVAISTTIVYGEEISCRGRILIFDVIEVVPEPGQPLTKNKFKMLYSKEQKGPVTALVDVEGFLASAVGQKIYIWAFRDNDLVGIAFIDSQIYIHQLSSIKNFILVADIKKSITLLNYSLEHRTLSLVSKDTKPLEVYACEYMVDDNQLAFLVSDGDKNLILYHYQPEARESFGGQRLLRRADINIGCHVTTFFRIRCKLTDPATEKIQSGYLERRHITMFATLDGSIGFLLPMTEKTYRRLLMLQNALVGHIPHTAGLNPKAFRMVRHSYRELQNPLKNILDGDLLWKYTALSILEKSDLAKKIGTSVEQILDDLMDVERWTSHF